MDVQLEVAPVRSRELASLRLVAPQHDAARAQVARARAAQAARGAGENARLTPSRLERIAPLAPALKRWLLDAVEGLGLSARGYHRVWRLARTLADLDGREEVDGQRLAEAMSFRAVEREKVLRPILQRSDTP
jgi:magnesium chelatase family protein